MAAQLAARHVFGLKGDVKANFAYHDDQTIVFVAGHTTVVHNLETRTQRFLHGAEKADEITALAMSSNRRFVAVAEKAEKATVTIFDLTSTNLKKKRPLTCQECLSREYVSLAFSPDAKYLMAQGGGPDWTLVIWTWEKNPPKVVVTHKTTNSTNSPVYDCSFSPSENPTIAVTGNGILKQFRLVDSTLKVLPNALGKREPQNYTAQMWLNDDRLVVGTDTSDLLLIEGQDIRAVINKGTGESGAVHCMAAYSKGFVCGGDDGLLTLYDKSEDKDYFKKSRTFRIDNNNVLRIRQLAVSPTEEGLVCVVESGQMYLFALLNAEIIKPEDNSFEPVTHSFHSGAITGLDLCIRKPLVATCGLDKSVRLWNYQERTVELVKFYADEAHSIAFHPSGLHLLVGFSDKLRLMNVLMDDIRWFKEFPIKTCRECRFSTGGQLFAAVNGNIIHIFSSYTCEPFMALRGHNGKVRSVSWLNDDTNLVSSGMDGAVYHWVIKENHRVRENVMKACTYTCAVADDSKSSAEELAPLYAVGSDSRLKCLTGNGPEMTVLEVPSATILTQVTLSNGGGMLFCASEVGTILSYRMPLEASGECLEYAAHSKRINRMRVSFDDSYLFSVGEDGCLFMFDIRERGKDGAKKDRELLPFAEEILVTKSDLEERTAKLQDLKTRVEELQHQMEYSIRLKELNHSDKIRELTDKHTVEQEAETSKYEMLETDKSDMEAEYEEKIGQMEERNQQTLESLERQYQQKIFTEQERRDQLENEKNLLAAKWDEQNAQLVDGHERLVQELTDDYEYKLQEERAHVESLKLEKEQLIQKIEDTRRLIEDDADAEIEELKEKFESKVKHEGEQNKSLKGQNTVMRGKFMKLQKEIGERSEQITQLEKTQQGLYHEIYLLNKEIAGKKKEVSERDQTIGDKEKRIYDLKKKNQELEKFKFVLDYKIKELKKQLEPRDAEIQAKQEQIQEMRMEEERYRKTTGGLQLAINDMKLKLHGLEQEMSLQVQRSENVVQLMKRYRHDVHDVIQHIDNPKLFKAGVKQLYHSHCEAGSTANDMDSDMQKEYSRHREYLEKSVEGLKRKIAKDMELHRTDNIRIMHENVSLLSEINELRRELKAMKDMQRGKEQPSGAGRSESDPQREVEMQRDEIRRLMAQIGELEANPQLRRPKSRESLPGFS